MPNRGVLALLLLLAGCAPLAPRSAAELAAALEAAQRVRVEGPAVVPLARRTTLQLQAGLVFIPAGEGGRLLRALGRPQRAGLLGVVIADIKGGIEAAALYGRGENLPGIPELEVIGWEPAPGLAVLAPR